MSEQKRQRPTSGLKLLTVNFKTAADDDTLAEGEFIGYAAVFNNIDSTGDKIMPGAFAESLESYGEKGSGVPVYWSHRMDDPMMNIGITKAAEEDEHGLKVHVKLDLDNPTGAYTHKLIKEGRVTQMSFAYDILDFAEAKTDEDGWFWELRKLKLHEVSVVPVGANQETELLAVKSLLSGVKAGRKLSTKNQDLLTQAKTLIEEVLSAVAEDEETEEEEQLDEESKSGKAEESVGTKAEDQVETKTMDSDPDAALALIDLVMTTGYSYD